jgi:hypothetical protein
MDAFPEFMKHPANRVVTGSQATPGVEGYVAGWRSGAAQPMTTAEAFRPSWRGFL